MRYIKKILLFLAIIFPPALIFSLGGGGTPYIPNYRDIQLRFSQLEIHGGLGYALHDINYVDVKEPNDFYFQNANGDMDVLKILNDYYGINNRGGPLTTTCMEAMVGGAAWMKTMNRLLMAMTLGTTPSYLQ